MTGGGDWCHYLKRERMCVLGLLLHKKRVSRSKYKVFFPQTMMSTKMSLAFPSNRAKNPHPIWQLYACYASDQFLTVPSRIARQVAVVTNTTERVRERERERESLGGIQAAFWTRGPLDKVWRVKFFFFIPLKIQKNIFICDIYYISMG